jgi:hypothetical protein
MTIMPASATQRDIMGLMDFAAVASGGPLKLVALGATHDGAVMPSQVDENAATSSCNCEARVQA